MKIVVAQYNAKFMTSAPVKLLILLSCLLCMSFNKAVFSRIVLNNLRNDTWTALIACANFSLEV